MLLFSSQLALAQFAQQAKLSGTDASLDSQQGRSVALSADGNTAIVGGPDDGAHFATGAAWVFVRSGTTWTQQGSKLVGTGASADPGQGRSVALSADGNTAIVGGSYVQTVWPLAGGVSLKTVPLPVPPPAVVP